jgi:hypothetical protein
MWCLHALFGPLKRICEGGGHGGLAYAATLLCKAERELEAYNSCLIYF